MSKISQKTNAPIKKLINTLITIIISFSILMIIFAGAYYAFINKNSINYEGNITKITDNINIYNSGVSALISNNGINVTASKKTLKEISLELEKLEKEIDAVPYSENYKNMHKALKSGVINNKMMYRQIVSIITSQSGTDVSAMIESYKNYKNSCELDYSNVTIDGKPYSLPEDTKKFLDNFEIYLGNLSK